MELFLSECEDTLKIKIYAEQIRSVYLRFTPALIGTILAAILLVVLQWNVIEHSHLVAWLVVYLVVTFFRGFLVSIFKRMKLDDRSCIRWGKYFFISSMFAGAVWALGVYVAFPEGDLSYQLTVALIVIGLSAGATSTISMVLWSYILFVFPMMLEMIALFIIEGTRSSYIVSVVMTFALVFIFRGAMNIYKSNIHNIRLRIEAEDRERDLIEARNSAEQATRVKSEFLANMSHEIRTPMNAVIGMTNLALQTKLTSQQRNYIDKAHSSAVKLLGVLNDILDFSKMESGKLNMEEIAFQLEDVVGDVVSLMQVKADERQIKLSVSIDADVPGSYMGDPLRLGQVLLNLANNAVKFSHEAGGVHIGVGVSSANDEEAVLCFTVKDYGVGITQEQKQILFQPFSQADNSSSRSYGGTGLGLVISKIIVEMMGGEIGVESEAGEGSVFWFTVRLKRNVSAEALSENPRNSEEDIGEGVNDLLCGARVLLVEDNEINQELVQEMLKRHGIEVTVADNGEEALKLLELKSFDGILMDCQMPVMDGYETTRNIRQQEKYKDLPIIALTANAMAGDREKVLAAGMDDHVAKPIEPEKMFDALLRWVRPEQAKASKC